MAGGISSENINPVSIATEVLVNGPDGTGRQAFSDFATQMAATGAVADGMEDLRDISRDQTKIYPTTAAGIAATEVDQTFNLTSTDPNVALYIYRHDVGGVATLIATTPSVPALSDKASGAIANAIPQRARAGRLSGDTGFVSGEVRAIIANTFAEFSTGFTVTGGEISVDGTGFGTPPRLFGRGEYRAAGVPARVVIEATVDAIGFNGSGAHIGFGADAASLVVASWWANAAAGAMNSAGVSISMRNTSGATINAGDRVRMTVEICADNLGTILCENLTTGAVRGIEISTPIPAGPIWAGWMRAVAGTIHSMAVEIGVAALPKVVGPDQREAWPNLVLTPDDWLRNASVASFGYVNGVLTLTGAGTVDCDLPVIAGQTAITLAFWLESIDAGNPQPQIFLGQFNAAGSGWVSGAEITAARYSISLGTSAVTTRRYYMARVPVNALAQRLVLRVSNNGAANILRLSDLLVTYDTDRHYRGRDIASGFAGDLAILQDKVGDMSATVASMVAQLASLTAGQEKVRQVAMAALLIILVSGQSLSIGTGSTPALTTTQPFNNKMLANGVLDYSADTSGITGPPTSTSLVPLVYNKIGESVGLGGANMVKALCNGAGITGSDLAVSNNGQGATLIANLSKGSNPYQWGLDQIALIKSLANAGGMTAVQQAIWWLQGESDAISPNNTATYKSQLNQLIEDWNADLPQVHRVLMLTYQMASHTRRGSGTTWTAPNIAQAQLECGLENPDIVMVAPLYVLPHNADGVHLPGHSARWLGQQFAKVHFITCVLGLDWKPTHIKAARRQGRLIDLEYHVPVGPLVIDTTLVTEATNYGFTAVKVSDGSAVAISSVSLRSEDSVRVALATDPGEEVRVRYAWGDPANNTTGPVTGARGNICDSDPTTSFYNNADGQPYPLMNWAAIQQIATTGY